MVLKDSKEEIDEKKEKEKDPNVDSAEKEPSSEATKNDTKDSDETQLKEEFNSYIIVHSSSEDFISTSNICVKCKDFANTVMHLIFEEKREMFKFVFVDEEAQEFLRNNKWFIEKISSSVVEASSESILNADIMRPNTLEYREYDNSFDAETLGGDDEKINSSHS